MAHWTNHTRYDFHCEQTNDEVGAYEIAAALSKQLGISTMVEAYTGAWNGDVTEGHRVTWIAPHYTDGAEDADRIMNALKIITGNKCVMPTRSLVELFCTCDG